METFKIYKHKDEEMYKFFTKITNRDTRAFAWADIDQTRLDPEDRGLKFHKDLRGNEDGYWDKDYRPSYNSKFAHQLIHVAFNRPKLFLL